MQKHVDGFIESLQAQNASVNTVRGYRRDLEDFATFLGSRPLTRRIVRQYLAQLHSGSLARTSIARKFAAVKSFSRWLGAEDIIAEDVAASVRAPRRPKELPPCPTEEQMDALLAEPFAGPFPDRDRLILHLLYASGMRVQELVGINLEDIQQPDVILVRGKG